MLSIIIPSYNEEGNVAKCASVVSKLLSENGIDYELVFVNDGSKDRTWDIISNLARAYRGREFFKKFRQGERNFRRT